MILKLTLMVFLFARAEIQAIKLEPHLHPEVKIVDYNGPFTAEMMSLFKSMEIIEFIDCNISSIPSNFLSLVPKFKKLVSVNVTIAYAHAEAAEGNSLLEDFEFIGNSWTGANLQAWNGFEHLKRLIIRDQKVPFVQLKANSLNRTKLKYLEISYSGVEKIDDSTFNNLDKLERLNLAGNKLKTFSNEILKPLKSLEKLDLQENLLESFDISQLPELPKLKSINLSKNPLKNFVLGDYEKVAPKLKSVQLSDTAISEKQLENLRKNSKIEIHKEVSIVIVKAKFVHTR